jgi:tetratricopeptide (TPR) repeat protein
VEALTELAAAARGLGAAPGAKAVEGRIRSLQQRERLLQTAAKARAAGHPSSVAFYEAEAALEVDRTAEALSSLKTAVDRSPAIVKLHLERARVRLLLGRTDLAEGQLRSGLEATRSPIFLFELSRIAAMEGSVEKARELLSEAKATPSKPVAGEDLEGPGEESLRRGLEARALIELEDYRQAEAALEAQLPEGESDDIFDLSKAELAIIGGRPGVASEILSGSFDNIPGGQAPGGAVWAAALRKLLAQGGEGAEGSRPASGPKDPSDFLDHPRLFLRPAYLRHLGGELPGAPPGWLERLRSAQARRRLILASMKGFGDADMVPRWRELSAIYVDLGASRKAREVAWYVIGLQSSKLEDHLALAVLLSKGEEVVSRIQVLSAALRLAPGDAALAKMMAEAREFLGLGPVKG